MQEENNGVSLGDIFKTIAKGKWIALIVAVVITLAGVLFIQLSYNKGKTEYVSSFGLTLPGDGNAAVYTYPDGTTLHYADIVSYPALEEVKNSDADFADIDIQALVNNQAISISRSVDETDAVTYTVVVNANYFKNYSVAKKFIMGVASRPVKYLSGIKLTYDSYLSLSNVAEDYENQIGFLKSQLDYVLYEFDNLVINYGGNFVVNGKTLSSYVNEIKAYKEKDRLTSLASQVRSEYLLKDDAYREEYKIKKIEVERQLNLAQATLDKLTAVQGGGNITYLDASVIKAQSDLVGKLTQQCADIQNYIDKGVEDKDFAKKIDKESAEISQFTESLKTAVSEVYEKASAVTFINVNAVTARGGMGLATSIVLSLVAGIIVALIVGYIVGKYAFGKNKTQNDLVAEFAEAEAQAAVTEDDKEEQQ